MNAPIVVHGNVLLSIVIKENTPMISLENSAKWSQSEREII